MEFGLAQLVDEPTRNANILDLIITNIPNLIESYGVSGPINDLDHCSIYGVLKFTYVKKLCYFRTISSYTIDNLNTLNDNLSHVPWPSLIISEAGDIDDMVDSFTTILRDEIVNAIPIKTVVIRPKDKPGMTCLVRRLFRKCHRLHKIAIRSKSAGDLENHRNARREAKIAWKQAQKIYYEKLNKKLENPDTSKKSYWKIIKSLQGQTKITSIPEIVENGKSYRDVKDIVTILNNYFVAQTKMIHPDESSLVPVVDADVNIPTLTSIQITNENILNCLKNLKLGKSNGVDGIGNIILRACAPNITEPLKMIAQKSLDAGVFPKSWKKSNVVPIFKHKGAKDSVANYRPISLLSCMSKVVERLVYNELYNFCMENGLLSEKNSGFKKKVGTIDQLIGLTNKIYQGLDDGDEIAMIFLDLSKAYDRVWHTGLLHKLQKIGIRGPLLDWFKSYLTGRVQRVVYAGHASEFLELFASVPQGSILAPLLFLIFLNDIEDGIQSNISLFADDVALLENFKNSDRAEIVCNKDLGMLHSWANTWGMEFNPSKTEVMIFSNKRVKSTPIFYLNGIKLNQVSVHKHLGLIFSESMKWSNHIDSCVKKARRKLGLLSRNAFKMNIRQRCDVYKVMIRPILEYGAAVIDNCSLNDSLKLESCQRYASLVCTGAMRRTETSKLMHELRWESLSSRRKYFKMLHFFKINSKFSPQYLINSMPQKVNANYRLRNTSISHFIPFQCRIESYKKSFFPSCTSIWNELSEEIINAESIPIFKRKIKIWLEMEYPSNNFDIRDHFHQGFLGKILIQMRFELSPLRAHLFNYNLIDNPFCPACGNFIETTDHYFFECGNYAAPRQSLLNQISGLDGSLSTQSEIKKIILLGSSVKNHAKRIEINKLIVKYIVNFLYATERFKPNLKV
jgi:hypothetical protein